jgi:hypothetical protein
VPDWGDYQPVTGSGSGFPAILRAEDLRRYMGQVAAELAWEARQSAPTPQTIQGAAEFSRDRWHAIIRNTSPGALHQEYGTARMAGAHPLGRVLDRVRAADPARRQGRGR